jgi:uncharacterized membrane protein
VTLEIIIGLVSSGILAIFASVTAPLILMNRTAAMHREDRLADWARQDAVAAEAKAAAAKVAAQLQVVDQRVAEKADATNDKLDVIHTLVNSNMTAAMQAELDAIRREIVMMREVVALNLAAGRQPTVEALAAIEATQVKITTLEAQLADREIAARNAALLHTAPKEPS